MEHKFRFSEYQGERKIYMVKCLKTTGEFSTALWNKGKVKNNICPCCNEEVKNDK